MSAKRVIYLLVLTLALWSAAVQYNDPDPMPWMAMYGYVALLYGLALAGRHSPRAARVGLVVAMLWAATFVPAFGDWIRQGMPSIVGKMEAASPHIELVREFLGLVLCASAFGGLLWSESAAHS